VTAPAAATYHRRVQASEARVWENVLDFEHLPFVHAHAFSSCEPLDADEGGWRARVRLAAPAGAPGPEILLALELDRPARRYVARTVEGPGAGTEIWTRVGPAGPEATDIAASFHVPGLAEGQRDAVGGAYTALYARLWDEDEAMMRRRQGALDGRLIGARPRGSGRLALGPAAALAARAPCAIEPAGVPLRVVAVGAALFAHAAVCPHQGGPLGADPADPARVRCPWHGFAFDVRDGALCAGRGAGLPFARRVEVDERGEAWLPLEAPLGAAVAGRPNA
jgi:nitrite reductase/ring-hydroxylating ferredoxin subunit